jgi:uncharacterized protein (DUF2252 family)
VSSREVPNPAELAARQFQRDLRVFEGRPRLLEQKRERMAASPFCFLRGSAPLFYHALRLAPHLAEGPKGKGWLVGDLHLENFGAYRPEVVTEEGPSTRVVFDVNDFDDAFVGPQRLDVLRILTSSLLAARDWGLSVPSIRTTGEVVLEGVLAGRMLGRSAPMPTSVKELIARVANRSRREFLDQRTRRTSKGRRFILGRRYQPLSAREKRLAHAGFAAYAESLKPETRWPAGAWRVRDVAFRVAGTGSLGSMRIAVLVTGKGGPDGCWLFDMKEEGLPAGRDFASSPPERGVERVLSALSICPEHPPRMTGKTDVGGRSMLVRRLTPEEDRLDLGALPGHKREAVLFFLGALVGALHRRSARQASPWKPKKARVLLDNAITLAGIHEAAAVHYASLVMQG